MHINKGIEVYKKGKNFRIACHPSLCKLSAWKCKDCFIEKCYGHDYFDVLGTKIFYHCLLLGKEKCI